MKPNEPTAEPSPAETASRAEHVFQHAAALHKAGRLEKAVAGYQHAIRMKPDFAGAFCNLGIALKQVGRLNEAIAAYRRALEIAPDFADAEFNLAILLNAVGRRGEAAGAYRHVAELKPGFAPAYVNLGNSLKEAGEVEQAAGAYRQALEVKPDHIGALANLGDCLNELGRHEQAMESCRAALAIKHDFIPALASLAAALSALGRHEAAVDAARSALAIKPDAIDALVALNAALKALGRSEDIVQAYHQALAASPDDAVVHCHLAHHYLDRDDPARALAQCDACLAANPGHIRALAIKCTALNELGARDELRRLACCDRLVLHKRWDSAPGYATMERFNQALARHVVNHPSMAYEPAGRATRSGRHSGELLVEPKGPIGALEQMICAAVADYDTSVRAEPGHPFLAHPPGRWNLTIWAVVLDQQGYQVPHIHPSGWLSGVYYVTLPKVVGDPGAGQAGWIEFGCPPRHYVPTVEPEVTTIQPEPGLMLLFPSYFYHRTLPFESDETRISIAFDVMPYD